MTCFRRRDEVLHMVRRASDNFFPVFEKEADPQLVRWGPVWWRTSLMKLRAKQVTKKVEVATSLFQCCPPKQGASVLHTCFPKVTNISIDGVGVYEFISRNRVDAHGGREQFVVSDRLDSHIRQFLRTLVLFLLVGCKEWFYILIGSLPCVRRVISCILYSLRQSRVAVLMVPSWCNF